jgi:uncharacterized protein (UPF0264 family)
MRLLVSAINDGDAELAAVGGADIIDLKNPVEGPLGAPPPSLIASVRAAVAPNVPVSVAIGDLPPLPCTAALAAAGAVAAGANYVKIGLGAVASQAEAVDLLQAVRSALRGEHRAAVIAAAYADAPRLGGRALAPALLPRTASAAGIDGCLLDTAIKDGRGLFAWLSPEAVAQLVAQAHAGGLLVALAGGLTEGDLPQALASGADIVGVRTAACRGAVRTAPLDPERIRRIRAACGEGSSRRQLTADRQRCAPADACRSSSRSQAAPQGASGVPRR